MKILVLCNKSPYPPREGGPIAMSAVIDGLLDAGHEVKVLAINTNKYFVDPDQVPDDYRQKTGLEMVYIDLSIKPLPAFFNLFTKKSYHVERFITKQFEKKLTSILQNEKFDIIQLELLYLAPYLKTIRKLSKAKIILRAHNIEHLIWERIAGNCKNSLKKFYLNHLYKTLKRFELEAITKFDGIAAITETDAAYFKLMAPDVPVIDLPFGIYPEKYPLTEQESEFPSLFHLGSMNWMPNEEGIKWFLNSVWPDVNKEFPQLKFYLAGRNMPDWLTQSKINNVMVVGEVEDAFEFMRSKSVMIVPLFSGSGIRIKIIEGMAAERAIVSTKIGAEGINITPGKNILIADSAKDYVDAIKLLVSDKDKCINLGKEARKLIEDQHNNTLLTQRLTKLYNKVL